MEAPLRPVVPPASYLRIEPRPGRRQRRGNGRSFADELAHEGEEPRGESRGPRSRPAAGTRGEEEHVPTIDVVG